MNTQQTNSRKELPKVCKKFPEEFFLQRQKTAQSTLGGLARDYDQLFDYDSLRNSNSGSLNKLNSNSSIRFNKNYNQQSINSYNQFANAPFTSNGRRNPSLPQFQQQQNNTKILNDLINSQTPKQYNLQNYSSQILKVQPQNVGIQQENKLNYFVLNSDNLNIPLIDDIFPHSSKNTYSSINNKQNEDENRKDLLQESIDKFHIFPQYVNEIQNLQNTNGSNIINDIKKDANGGRRSNSSNSYHNFYPKSNSSSSTKRTEIINKKKIQDPQELQKQEGIQYDNLGNIHLIQSNGNLFSSNNLSKNKSIQQFLPHTEYASDQNRNFSTQEKENQINFQKANFPISQNIYIDEQNIGNSQSQQASNYYNPIRASSSSACFQNYSDNKQIASLTSIPFFGIPSTSQQSNKQMSLHSISSQSTKNSQISKNQQLNKNNVFEPSNSHQEINQNYQINSPQTNQISTTAQFYSFRLPRIQFSNNEGNIQIPNNNVKTLLNDNNQPLWNLQQLQSQQINEKNQVNSNHTAGITKQSSFTFQNKPFSNTSDTNQFESNQVFAMEQNQQILDQIKQREIKTPSFNTRKNRQNGTSLRQLTEEPQVSNKMISSHNYLSLLQQQKQMNFTLNLNQFNLKHSSDQSSQISSRQENPSNILTQSPKTNLFQSKDEINQQQIDLNTSFGNYQSNQTKNTEDYYTSVNDNNAHKKINNTYSKKKSFIQQNFKSSKEQEIQQQQSSNVKTSTQQADDQTILSQSKQQLNDNQVNNQGKYQINSETDRVQQQSLSKRNSSKDETLNQQSQNNQIDAKDKIDDLQINLNKEANVYLDDIQQKKFKRKAQSQQQSLKKGSKPVRILQLKQNNPIQQNENNQKDQKINNNLEDNQITPFNLEQQFSQQQISTSSSTPISTSDENKKINNSQNQSQNIQPTKTKQFQQKQGIEKLTLNSDKLKQFRNDQNLMFTFSTPQYNNNQIKIDDMLNQVQLDQLQQDIYNSKSDQNIYSEEKKLQNNQYIQRQRVQSHTLTKQSNNQYQNQPKSLQDQCYYVGLNSDSQNNQNNKKEQKLLSKDIYLKQFDVSQKDTASIIKQQYEQIESAFSQNLKLQSQFNIIQNKNKNSNTIQLAK